MLRVEMDVGDDVKGRIIEIPSFPPILVSQQDDCKSEERMCTSDGMVLGCSLLIFLRERRAVSRSGELAGNG